MFRESRRLRRARKRLAFAVMLLSLSSCSAPEPPPPLPPEGDLAISVEAVVGCYHVIRTDWIAPSQPLYAGMSPPDSFQLSADIVGPGGPDARRKVLVPGRWEASLRSWSVTGSKDFTIVFSTGFTGVRLVLHQRASDHSFYGRMQTFSDGGSPGPLPQGTVLLERVPC
jgi:hypothetical protein